MLHKLRFFSRNKRASHSKRKWPFTPSQMIATLREFITIGSNTVALTKKENEVLKLVVAAGTEGVKEVDLSLQVSRNGLQRGKLHSALQKLQRMELIGSRKSATEKYVGSTVEGKLISIYFATWKGAAFLNADNQLSATALRASDKDH